MNHYTVCPSCGYKLFKAGGHFNIEILCPKCREKMMIEIKDNKIVILRVLSAETQTDT